MTHREEIDAIWAMPAGPEMDALVAERVMGQALDREHSWATEALLERGGKDGTLTGWLAFHCGLCGARWEEVPAPPCTNPSGRKYSTDIAAAWEVLVHLVERNDRTVVANSTTDRRVPFEIQAGDLGSAEPHTVFVHVGWPQGVERIGTDGARYQTGFASVHDIRGLPLAICRAAIMSTLQAEP